LQISIMLSLASSSLAFTGPAPVARVPLTISRSMAPSMKDPKLAIPFLPRPKMLDGSMVGDVGFDPLRLSELIPLSWAREAELKHGRICMLAWAGYVAVDLGFREPHAPQVSSALAHDVSVANGSFQLLLIVLVTIELFAGVPKAFQLMNDPNASGPGVYYFDPLGFNAKGTPESKALMELKELTNGRAAMLAFSGVVTQSVLTGGGFPYTN